MSQWYVKDLSKITGVSVQTLHHYDRIDLLKPSIRSANGYRVYSEQDLLKLQQIIALKYFGFELAKIKELLAGNANALQHFDVQARFLEQKAQGLFAASKTLKSIIENVTDDQSIPWQTIIELIEVYRMTEQLNNAWVKEILTPNELKEYIAFETSMKSEKNIHKAKQFEKDWDAVLSEVEQHLSEDPTGKIGIKLGERCMQIVNQFFGVEHAHLRTRMFEKGFGEGIGLKETGFTQQSQQWLDKAVDTYWRERIRNILDQVGKEPDATLRLQWHTLLEDMYGNEHGRKHDLFNIILQEDEVSVAAKEWLKKIVK